MSVFSIERAGRYVSFNHSSISLSSPVTSTSWVLMKYWVKEWGYFLNYWPSDASLATSWHGWHGSSASLFLQEPAESWVLQSRHLKKGDNNIHESLGGHSTPPGKETPGETALIVPFMARFYNETPENKNVHNLWD